MNIGIVIFKEAEELDFVGPWEAFTMSNNVSAFTGWRSERPRLPGV